METTKLKADPRSAVGTRAARKLRAGGQLPAVIYGHGEPPESVSLSRREVESSLAHGARTLEIHLNGVSKQYLIKEVQYDHLDTTAIHLDLARVDMDERVVVQVGVELRGVPKGVADGGVLEQLLAEIEIECRVTDIPDTLHPMVTELGVGDSLTVKDLELPPGVLAKGDPDERVATVRAVVEAPEPEEEAEDEAEAGQPERIGRIRKDDEGADTAKS